MSYDDARLKARLLVTGFEPFGGQAVNPSERMVRLIAASVPPGVVISTRVLPVAYRRAFAPVSEALEAERLKGAILLGIGAGRATLDFERFGVNWRGAPQPDNDGLRISGEKIDPAGPAAYFSTLPVDDMVTACRAAGAPTGVSSHAGTFLGNQLLYQTLRQCDRSDLKCRVGFVHLPLLPEQASPNEPAVSEDAMIAGLRAAIGCLADRA
jgi:pyroglutamyl-peptidase